MLVTTAASLEVKLQAAMQANTVGQYQDEATSSFQFSPITSVDGIKALEQNLKEELFTKRLIIHMKKQIGHTGDNCNGQNVCYELIDHFFDRKVLLLCSWSGGSKGETPKFSMKDCERILNIFFKIVHSVNITFSRKLLEDFFKKITRNSKKRSEAKGMRQSSIHRRIKKKGVADSGDIVVQVPTSVDEDVQDAQTDTVYHFLDNPIHITKTGQTQKANTEHDDDDVEEEEEDETSEDDPQEECESD
ncbi:uncharacterized protein LOC135713274 [Ochlerotatus camptorhynchus]|uniref:uncharacterized protein LOC135713274 n=1 Tax=Ochlerotatus camptorhynchus TaxID=644619 RepID=UPI0031D8517D